MDVKHETGDMTITLTPEEIERLKNTTELCEATAPAESGLNVFVTVVCDPEAISPSADFNGDQVGVYLPESLLEQMVLEDGQDEGVTVFVPHGRIRPFSEYSTTTKQTFGAAGRISLQAVRSQQPNI